MEKRIKCKINTWNQNPSVYYFFYNMYIIMFHLPSTLLHHLLRNLCFKTKTNTQRTREFCWCGAWLWSLRVNATRSFRRSEFLPVWSAMPTFLMPSIYTSASGTQDWSAESNTAAKSVRVNGPNEVYKFINKGNTGPNDQSLIFISTCHGHI